MLHDAAVPSGRVSSIDSSSSNSIRSGARITAPAPVKRQTLMSFFVNPAARSGMVVARDKPVVATQAADVGNRWWDEDEEEQIDDEAEKRERTKRANESAQAWAKFFLRITPPAPVASSFATTLHEDLAQMQRTSEKPDTLRSEKRARDWLKDGAKHGDFSRGEGLEALKQAQSIAKEEQAKNLTIAATSEKKAKSLAIAAANRATGVPRKTIKRHLAADLTCGVAKKGPKPILDRNEHGICIERKLVDHLLHCADIGLGLDWNLVEVYVVDMCKAYGITDDFVASNGWKGKFMARHPELTRRLGTRFECARAGAMNAKGPSTVTAVDSDSGTESDAGGC